MKVAARQKELQVHSNVLVNKLRVKKVENTILERVKFIAKVIFSLLLTLVLACINPAIFFISFMVGVAFSKIMQKAVEKIKIFMRNYKWPVIIGSVILGAFLLPVVVATGSVIWSAYIGSYLSTKAQQAYEQRNHKKVAAQA